MLFRKFDFTDKQTELKFQFDKSQHQPSWEHYYTCYNYTIKKVFNKGFQRNYAFNCRSRGLLFLIRHSIELCLKLNLELNGLTIPNSHEFKVLLAAFNNKNVIPFEFKNLIEKLNHNPDGSCYRYYMNTETGKPFFGIQEKIELADFIKKYNEIPTSETFKKGDICESFKYENKWKIWDLTFHMGECYNIAQIRTQYDEVIEFLVEGVLFDSYDINKIYIPLLFLIRHSLELALKSNLYLARRVSPSTVPDKEYDKIHSLAQLYNCFGEPNGYLSKLDLTRLSQEIRKQYDLYKKEYESLNKEIHQLDSNSLSFRYPVDKNGNTQSIYIKEDGLYKILKLYYLTDPFITFVIDVLEDEAQDQEYLRKTVPSLSGTLRKYHIILYTKIVFA